MSGSSECTLWTYCANLGRERTAGGEVSDVVANGLDGLGTKDNNTDGECKCAEDQRPCRDVGLAVLGNAAAVVELEDHGEGADGISNLSLEVHSSGEHIALEYRAPLLYLHHLHRARTPGTSRISRAMV
jgi:hypothetical protein